MRLLLIGLLILLNLNGCSAVTIPEYPPLSDDFLKDPCCHGQRIDGFKCADKDAYIECNGKCERWANCKHLIKE